MLQKDGDLTDLELVQMTKAGDLSAFSQLVTRHQRALIRTCVRFVKDLARAEDIAQEAFIKAFEKLDTFEERASFKSWLFQIALNTARNSLRSKKSDFLDLDQVHYSVSAWADKKIVQEDFKARVHELIEKLPERQKEALVLRIFEDLSFQEIADIMECPYDTAKANYRHGLLKIKKDLEGFASEIPTDEYDMNKTVQFKSMREA